MKINFIPIFLTLTFSSVTSLVSAQESIESLLQNHDVTCTGNRGSLLKMTTHLFVEDEQLVLRQDAKKLYRSRTPYPKNKYYEVEFKAQDSQMAVDFLKMGPVGSLHIDLSKKTSAEVNTAPQINNFLGSPTLAQYFTESDELTEELLQDHDAQSLAFVAPGELKTGLIKTKVLCYIFRRENDVISLF